jgi:hypothetical protein
LKGVIPFKKYGTRKRIEEAAKSSEPEVACRGPWASAFFYAFRAERRELVLNSFTTCRVAYYLRWAQLGSNHNEAESTIGD